MRIVGFILFFTQTAPAPGLVGFVQDHRAEFPFQQNLPFRRIVENQPRGNDGDAEAAAGDVFRTPGVDDVAMVILPDYFGAPPTPRLPGK